MKASLRLLQVLLFVLPLNSLATIRYVDATSITPSAPFTSWATAAATIQDAVDASSSGDQIIITNGSYSTGRFSDIRVYADKAVTIRSVNGPQVTLINGGGTAGCAVLANGATLIGFTLTNGSSSYGAGVQGDSLDFPSTVVQNCIITGNSAGSGSGGGGAACTLNNCLIIGNSGYMGGGTYFCTMNNCTVVSNTATYLGGGSWSTNGEINNTILYYNTAPDGPNWSGYGPRGGPAASQYYCCTTPIPSNGAGNITNPPLFIDLLAGNFRLQSNSACINAGTNAKAVGPADLAGGPRIVGGTVDIGAYEFQPLPALRIAHSNGLLTISWPLWASNFALQQASNVPASAWSNVTAPVNPTPTENFVNLPLNSVTKFFRLRSP